MTSSCHIFTLSVQLFSEKYKWNIQSSKVHSICKILSYFVEDLCKGASGKRILFCTFKNGAARAKIANRRGNAKFIDIWFRIEPATFYPPAKPICIQLEGQININWMKDITSRFIFCIQFFIIFHTLFTEPVHTYWFLNGIILNFSEHQEMLISISFHFDWYCMHYKFPCWLILHALSVRSNT